MSANPKEMWGLFNYEYLKEVAYSRRDLIAIAEKDFLREGETWAQVRRKGWLRIAKIRVDEI